jgi:Baseplate J-like protein
MKITLPNLDDRPWADLVEEGRSLIPVFAPEWTDHNLHDPGITTIELLAWIAEMDLYQLNRISDRAKRKFLSLIGIAPFPPRAARTILNFVLTDPGNAPLLSLRAGAEFNNSNAFGPARRFRTLDDVNITPGRLAAVQSHDKKRFYDLTDHLRKGEAFSIFGARPEPGAEFYLGFSKPWPLNEPVSIFFALAGRRSDEQERLRIIEEIQSRQQACYPPPLIHCDRAQQHEHPEPTLASVPPRARIEWEIFVGGTARWLRLDPSKHEIDDDTAGLTLDGRILFRIPTPMAKTKVGVVETELYYVRGRFEAGALDAPPQARSIALNGVRAEQSVPVSSQFTIAAGVVVQGPAPIPGKLTRISQVQFTRGEISQLSLVSNENIPAFLVLGYQAATVSNRGFLNLEARFLGVASGEPEFQVSLPEPPVEESSLQLYSLAGGVWQSWERRADFDSSARGDAHYVLDATSGLATFGNINKGHVPPRGALIFAAYRTTQAEEGNLGPNTITELSNSAHNRASIPDFDQVKNRLAVINNSIPATGGASAETLAQAQGRALALIIKPQRAVTLADYEQLARETPGVQLARVTARANLLSGYPCWKAPGLITVIIMPSLPANRPVPSVRLRRRVAAYLERRRIVGTRVEVVGPTYVEISVRARVQALDRTDSNALQQRVVDALNDFFDPLRGGPEKNGWPFGRDVYRSEVLQVLDEVEGVNFVSELALTANGCPVTCSNVCIEPTTLVVAGPHEIEVVGGEGGRIRAN